MNPALGFERWVAKKYGKKFLAQKRREFNRQITPLTPAGRERIGAAEDLRARRQAKRAKLHE